MIMGGISLIVRETSPAPMGTARVHSPGELCITGIRDSVVMSFVLFGQPDDTDVAL